MKDVKVTATGPVWRVALKKLILSWSNQSGTSHLSLERIFFILSGFANMWISWLGCWYLETGCSDWSSCYAWSWL